MKLFLKKYGIPLLGATIMCLLLFFLRKIQNLDFNTKEIFIMVSIFSSTLLIRTVDDIIDYKEDIRNNKKTFKIHLSYILGSLLLLIGIIMNILSVQVISTLLFIIYVAYMTFAFYKKSRILKIFIYPILIVVNFTQLMFINNGLINYPISIVYISILTILTLSISIIFGIVKKG